MFRSSIVLSLVASLSSGCSERSEPPTGSVVAAPVASKAARGNAKAPADARALLARGTPALDVRTADEVAAGKLPGATHIPLDELRGRLAEVEALVKGDKAAPLVVYCRTGRRSASALDTLVAAGFTNVINGGGYDELR